MLLNLSDLCQIVQEIETQSPELLSHTYKFVSFNNIIRLCLLCVDLCACVYMRVRMCSHTHNAIKGKRNKRRKVIILQALTHFL